MTFLRHFWARMLAFAGIRTLEVEVKAHVPVLPALRNQLTDTASEMERAVVDVCASFQGIAANARTAVDETSRLLGSGDDPNGVDGVIASSRTTIERLLARMEHSSGVSLRSAARIEAVEAALQGITKAVAEVDNIAFANRMLALNAKIEAVHVGEAGAGFGVVADEITAQAAKSTEITDRITETLKQLRQAITGAAAELRTMASDDKQNLEASRNDVRAALDDLARATSGMHDALSEARSRSGQLADEISRAVIGLQFQDRLSQRIAHVTGALESMERSLSRCLGKAASAIDAAERHSQIVSGLEQACTMEGERAVLAGAPREERNSNDDVELF